MELNRKRALCALQQAILQKSEAVSREMDESPWSLQNTHRMEHFLRLNFIELHQKERQALVYRRKGPFKHQDWTYGQKQV